MKSRKSCAFIVVMATFCMTSAWAQEAIPVFVAKELGLQQAMPGDVDFERPFEAPLPARIADSEGKRLVPLNNCREYLAVRGGIVGSDNDADFRVLRLQTVPCVALALLQSATPAIETALPPDFLAQTSASSYPASLWPAVADDERQRLSAPDMTLAMAAGETAWHVLKGELLELEAGDFGVHLTLLARGDFDHDGWEDAAFRWEAYARKGSYTDARLVILTRTEMDAVLRELSPDTLLAQQGKKTWQ
jgi:hypothetical protein